MKNEDWRMTPGKTHQHHPEKKSFFFFFLFVDLLLMLNFRVTISGKQPEVGLQERY